MRRSHVSRRDGRHTVQVRTITESVAKTVAFDRLAPVNDVANDKPTADLSHAPVNAIEYVRGRENDFAQLRLTLIHTDHKWTTYTARALDGATKCQILAYHNSGPTSSEARCVFPSSGDHEAASELLHPIVISLAQYLGCPFMIYTVLSHNHSAFMSAVIFRPLSNKVTRDNVPINAVEPLVSANVDVVNDRPGMNPYLAIFEPSITFLHHRPVDEKHSWKYADDIPPHPAYLMNNRTGSCSSKEINGR